MTRFALLGAAGYVAPKHLDAIQRVGGDLVAACDPHDSVGVLDSYAAGCRYFSEVERFDRHLEKLRRRGEGIDYLSVCTPNYLHDAHCRLGLRLGASVICEKPLVLNPWNVGQLRQLEAEHPGSIHPVLQLRYHPLLLDLRKAFADGAHKADVSLTYTTFRGPWYAHSWKGDEARSGGLVTNIGIHLIDLLLWIFGPCEGFTVTTAEPDLVCGHFDMTKASVRWSLSTRPGPTTRLLRVDGREVRLEGFGSLHTSIYQAVLAGSGLTLDDAEPAITLAHAIRQNVR